MSKDDFLSREEVMAILKLKKATLHRMMKDGRLPYYKLGEGRAGRILIKRADLDAFLESRKVIITSKPAKKARTKPK